MRHHWRILVVLAVAPFVDLMGASRTRPVLRGDSFRHYIEGFNRTDDERTVNYIDNKSSWEWLQQNIPLFECSDKRLEEIYYFRWWTYRKHIKRRRRVSLSRNSCRRFPGPAS